MANYIPCPKCGSQRVRYMDCVGRMKCMACGFKGGSGKTREEALRLWNANKR